MTDFDIRQIPEYRDIPGREFVAWYHDLLGESQAEVGFDYNAGDLGILRAIITSMYTINKREYSSKLPPSRLKIRKLQLFHPVYQLMSRYGKKYQITVLNKKPFPTDCAILIVPNINTAGVIPIIREALNIPISALIPSNDSYLTQQTAKQLATTGGYFYEKDSESARNEAQNYLTAVLAKGGHGLVLPNATPEFEEERLAMDWDLAEIAKNSQANILPVSVDAFNGDFYVNMGNPLSVNVFDSHEAIHENVGYILAAKRAETWNYIDQNNTATPPREKVR